MIKKRQNLTSEPERNQEELHEYLHHNSRMLVHVRGNFLTAKGSLAHCISKDCAMSLGVARQVREAFGRIQEIKNQNRSVGEVAILDIEQGHLYNMITKDKYYNKPTLGTLGECLNQVKIHMLAKGVERVSMPRIACGLDRLCWEDVEKLIEEIFFKSGITVVIYTL